MAEVEEGGGGGEGGGGEGEGGKVMSMEEIKCELLECARYGEEEDLIEMLTAGAPIDHADAGGNTALHKACANDHAGVVALLAARGASFLANGSGNTPLHWAVQNGAKNAVQALLKHFPDIDVLQQNGFGQGSVTDAFNTTDTEIVKVLLEHSSAKKLEPKKSGGGGGGGGDTGDAGNAGDAGSSSTADGAGLVVVANGGPGEKRGTEEEEGEEKEAGENVAADMSKASSSSETDSASTASLLMGSGAVQEHVHRMVFTEGGPELRLREVATDDWGLVFTGNAAADTTGTHIWAAGLVFSRWLISLPSEALRQKSVLELGAGCGLPGLVAQHYGGASHVVLTDFHQASMDNLSHNAKNNPCGTAVADTQAVDWTQEATWPKGCFDVVLGCDLVYDKAIVPALVRIISAKLAPNGNFYYVSGGRRDGAKAFVAAMRECMECTLCPLDEAYKANPLVGVSDNGLHLHFNELEDERQLLFKFRHKDQE